jgi:probable phosphoglycerate mutase
MPTLYFLRHGETDWNAEGRLQGQTDIPLNSKGRAQAAGIARAIRAGHIAGVTVDHLATLPFFASPMTRARETMEIIRTGLGLPRDDFNRDDRLKEIGFGRWEGCLWREVQADDPVGSAARERDKWNYVPPGGESYEFVQTRVSAWLATIPGDACVVAHGGIARVLLVLLADLSRKRAVSADIWQGKLLRLGEGDHDWLPGPGHLDPG